jgi:hypothetical protein
MPESPMPLPLQITFRNMPGSRIFENLTVPGYVIAIHRSHGADPSHADAYVALRDAFNAARRKLQDYERHKRGHTKTHQPDERISASRSSESDSTAHIT